MPFAGYANFDACVAANSDKDDPEAYCATIMRAVEKHYGPGPHPGTGTPQSHHSMRMLYRGVSPGKYPDEGGVYYDQARTYADGVPTGHHDRSGGWFTDSLWVARRYAKDGRVIGVRVTNEQLQQFRTRNLGVSHEWFLPRELVDSAEEVHEQVETDDRKRLSSKEENAEWYRSFEERDYNRTLYEVEKGERAVEKRAEVARLLKHAVHDQSDHGNWADDRTTTFSPGTRVFPFEDRSTTPKTFHYVATDRSKPKTGQEPTLCGKSTANMRASAPFKPGDPRGRVHFDYGCDECIDILSEADVSKRRLLKHGEGDQKPHGNWADGSTTKTDDEDTSYRGYHQPSSTYGAPAHDLTVLVADDIYTHPEWYFHMDSHNALGARILQRLRNSPDAPVKIYRAVPTSAPDEINDGDWVTTVPSYAKLHGESNLNDDFKVLTRTVTAKELMWPGDSIVEFGWFPDNPFATGEAITLDDLEKSVWFTKHDSPRHSGTGTDQLEHGKWADGLGGSRDQRSRPENQLFGQVSLPGTRLATDDDLFDSWMDYIATLDEPPSQGWTPDVLRERIADMARDKVTPEWEAKVDEAIGDVFTEPAIERFARRYGVPPIAVATRDEWGNSAGDKLGQHMRYSGGFIVIYENDWTQLWENRPAGYDQWVDKDKLEVWHFLSDEEGHGIPSHVGEGARSTIRHEYGHYVETMISPADHRTFRSLYYQRLKDLGADGDFMGGTLGRNQEKQYEWFTKPHLGGQFPSTYGMTNEMEGFAELFAAVTHPKYERVNYHSELWPLLEFMEGLA